PERGVGQAFPQRTRFRPHPADRAHDLEHELIALSDDRRLRSWRHHLQLSMNFPDRRRTPGWRQRLLFNLARVPVDRDGPQPTLVETELSAGARRFERQPPPGNSGTVSDESVDCLRIAPTPVLRR